MSIKRNMTKTKNTIIFLIFISIILSPIIGLSSEIPMGIQITPSQTTVITGNRFNFDVNYRVLQLGNVQEDEQLIIELGEYVDSITPMYSSKHFKAMKVTGNKILLTFNGNIENGLAGYLSVSMRAMNYTEGTVKQNIKITFRDVVYNNTVNILPYNNNGSEIENRSIINWAPTKAPEYYQNDGGNGVLYPDYNEIEYNVDVNSKKGKLENVIVNNYLPMEMEIIPGTFKIYDMNTRQFVTDKFIINHDSRQFNINFNNINDCYRIYYKAKVVKRIHRFDTISTVSYKEDHRAREESSSFTVKTFENYGSLNAYELVDKSVVGNFDKQIVAYDIIFDTENTFSANMVKLQNKLHPDVKLVDIISTKEFEISYDKDTHALNIINSKGDIIPENNTRIRIIVDFSKVKSGDVVKNTIGTNVVQTYKKHLLTFKNIDSKTGAPLGNTKFSVEDRAGKVLYEEITTSQDGTAQFEVDSLGIYVIKQIRAAEGYKLSSDIIEFEVSEGNVGMVHVGVIANEKIIEMTPLEPSEPIEEPNKPETPQEPEKPILSGDKEQDNINPDTGDSTSSIVVQLIMGCISILGLSFIIKKKK